MIAHSFLLCFWLLYFISLYLSCIVDISRKVRRYETRKIFNDFFLMISFTALFLLCQNSHFKKVFRKTIRWSPYDKVKKIIPIYSEILKKIPMISNKIFSLPKKKKRVKRVIQKVPLQAGSFIPPGHNRKVKNLISVVCHH